jgi:hypothetical protein
MSKDDQPYLESLLKIAEEATMPPQDPAEGVPIQWLPSWIRWPLKVLLLPFIHLDLFAQTVAKFFIRPPFRQVGACKKRGNCCHYILIPEAKGVMGKLFYFWQTQVNGFYLREPTAHEFGDKKVQVMGCRYLKKNGECSMHFFRPMVCRKWPVIEHFGRPRILKGCGYKAVVRKGYAKKYPVLKEMQDE